MVGIPIRICLKSQILKGRSKMIKEREKVTGKKNTVRNCALLLPKTDLKVLEDLSRIMPPFQK